MTDLEDKLNKKHLFSLLLPVFQFCCYVELRYTLTLLYCCEIEKEGSQVFGFNVYLTFYIK